MNGVKIESLGELTQFGEMIHRSNFFNTSSAQQGSVLAQIIMESDMTILDFMQTYNNFGDKIGMKADAMLANFLADENNSHEIVDRSESSAAIKLTSSDLDGKIIRERTFTITWDDIKDEPFTKGKNGKVKKGYDTPRGRMQRLWARLVSDSIRAFDPRVNAGLYTPEEIEDFTEEDSNKSKPTARRPRKTQPAAATEEPKSKEEPKTAPNPDTDSVQGQDTEAVKDEGIDEVFVFPEIKSAEGKAHPLSGKPISDASIVALEYFTNAGGDKFPWITADFMDAMHKELEKKNNE